MSLDLQQIAQSIQNLGISSTGFIQNGAGAVSRTVQSKLQETIDAADFGITAGGSAASNTAGMLAMRNFMVTNRQKHYNIMMPQGLVQFTDAKWLHNVRSFTIWGGPTQLQNVGTSSSTTENIPIWFNEIFLDNAGTPPGSGTEVNGYTINTNPKFSNSVTLVSSANVSNFAVNTWVLVYGYNQASSGYPPSMRTFEYERIPL
jgi:hypothetical protein